ncbi:MAG TPA: T9SS type A sorting domain-containing protein, partial [Flavisolibacter sp.]|nr:T9SS type A sorting domain-containing protein [Flavisolibacter sp.]
KTGDWQVWQTVSATVNLSSGTQTLRIISSSPQWNGWNFNWMEIAGSGATGNINGRTALQVIDEDAISLPSINLFPNPVTSDVTLKLNNSYEGSYTVQILNMGGALQKQFRVNKEKGLTQTRLSLSDLPKGQYILITIADKEKQTIKFVKQ